MNSYNNDDTYEDLDDLDDFDDLEEDVIYDEDGLEMFEDISTTSDGEEDTEV